MKSYPIEFRATTIMELIRQGNYAYATFDVNDQNFRVDVTHRAEVILRHFNRDMSTDAVLNALGEEGLRPATMSELLALGIKYPDLQEQFPITALGSACHGMLGDSYVGYLHSCGGQRRLGLNLIDGNWDANYRFAAVRK